MEDVNELALLVAEMRRAQKAYFRSDSSKTALQHAQSLEKKVDALVAETLSGPDLFRTPARDWDRS